MLVLNEIKNADEFRQWLQENASKEKECWVCVNRQKKALSDVLSYIEAVEQALCFGWIDSTLKKLDEGFAFQRFTLRKKNSNWTELNKERARRLVRLGLMTPAGEAVLPDLSEGSFQIDDKLLTQLQSDEVLWQKFQQLPALYVRVRLSNIQFYFNRKEIETAERQWAKFVENTRKGIIYGEWNDNGKLL